MNDEPTPAQRWRQALQELTRDDQSAAQWRSSRYTFAHRLGSALTRDPETGGPLTGPVIYGIWLDWGLIHIGQTTEAERRLKDLDVGQSHQLASTFPPEIWHRVVVLPWPRLRSAPDAIARLPRDAVGLGLEYGLQSLLRPLASTSRSRSRGARAYRQIGELFAEVKEVWDQAEKWPPGGDPLPGGGHVVFPAELLPSAPPGRMEP